MQYLSVTTTIHVLRLTLESLLSWTVLGEFLTPVARQSVPHPRSEPSPGIAKRQGSDESGGCSTVLEVFPIFLLSPINELSVKLPFKM